MKINSIQLQNFSCFLDERFTFSEGLNIISAKNGAGKSQLFNAFYWTLFGKIYDRNDGFISCYDETLAPDFYKTENSPEEFTTKVTIELTSFDVINKNYTTLAEYTIEREISFKRENNSIKVISPSSLDLSYIIDGETEFVRDGARKDIIDLLFPQKIRRFMWYVGETMKDLIDFESGQALNYALDQISYYPTYKKINTTCIQAESKLTSTINKELNKRNKLNTAQKKIINDIDYKKRQIIKDEELLKDNKIKEKGLIEECEKISIKLKGYDHFTMYKTQLTKIEGEYELTKEKINLLDQRVKEKMIGTWMLNGCLNLINSSTEKLEILGKELEKKQGNNNPIPNNLPGTDYVQKMIDDCKCYICERELEKDSDAYMALHRRVNDIEINRKERILQENYTSLMRFKGSLNVKLPSIQKEIQDVFEEKEKLIRLRREQNRKKQNLFVELDIPENQRNSIISGATTAKELMTRYDVNNKARERCTNLIKELERKLERSNKELNTLISENLKFAANSGVELIEENAIKYVKLIANATKVLKEEAWTKMIKEIEEKSNELYSIYLSQNPPGKIVVSKDVDIVDFKSNESLEGLSTAQENAGKLSVINAILSLSEVKKQQSYPLIMDAPTSDYDPENTISITTNISKTFKQIIIMSKDYQQLSNSQRSNLIKDASISNYYNLTSVHVGDNTDDSRTNKKSISSKIH